MTEIPEFPTSRRQRRVILWGGLLTLSVVNLLDLVGVLALALTAGDVTLAAMVWTLAIFVLTDHTEVEEIRMRLLESQWSAIAWMVLILVTGVLYPETSWHYQRYATFPGQVATAGGPAVAVTFVSFAAWYVWARILEYRDVTKRTPEQRVFGEDVSESEQYLNR